MDISNSTFSGNTATGTDPNDYTGGGAIHSAGPASVANSTFSANSAATAGADFQIANGATVTLKSTILGSSGGSSCSVYDTGTFLDAGYNISSDATCGLSIFSNSQPSTNPLLGALENNGGPTQTMLPGPPAIDKIPSGSNGCGTTVATDQRGIARPQGSNCDIGAVEVEVTYSVSGFSAPVNNDGVVNLVRAGRVIPLKFRVTDETGAPVPGLTSPPVLVSSIGRTCEGGVTSDAVERYAGGSGLRDLGGGYYRFDWQTPKRYRGQCRTLKVTIGDRSGDRTAEFRFR